MALLQCEIERRNYQAVKSLSESGRELARQTGASAENAVFTAQLAYALTFDLVDMDMDVTARVGFTNVSGVPLITEDELTKLTENVEAKRDHIDRLFNEALADARSSKNLGAMYAVAILHANAISRQSFPLAIVMVPEAEALLRELQGRNEKWVFARPSGQRLGYKFALDAFKQAQKAEGVEGYRLHDYRRSVARRLERNGVPRTTAKKITGHRTDYVFEKYAVSEDDDMRQALRAMGTRLGTHSGSGARKS